MYLNINIQRLSNTVTFHGNLLPLFPSIDCSYAFHTYYTCRKRKGAFERSPIQLSDQKKNKIIYRERFQIRKK
jgi:hypothetical protein